MSVSIGAQKQDSKTEAAAWEAQIVGDWIGDSICTAARSACKDEHVIFHFSKTPNKKDSFTVIADKIVKGQNENMGTLEFAFAPAQEILTAKIPLGTWQFRLKGSRMEGTLFGNDRTVFRNVRLEKKK